MSDFPVLGFASHGPSAAEREDRAETAAKEAMRDRTCRHPKTSLEPGAIRRDGTAPMWSVCDDCGHASLTTDFAEVAPPEHS